MVDRNGSGFAAHCEVASDDGEVQTMAPPGGSHRYEGIAFSPSGDAIAIATSDSNAILWYRRNGDGRFEDTPHASIEGAAAGLDYPHDTAFCRVDGRELFAVANRGGTVAVWQKRNADDDYRRAPDFEIGGPDSGLEYSDGVAFVPPRNDHLAVCNLLDQSITFYRMVSRSPLAFGLKPVFTLRHETICQPDGIAFSSCGRWLAVANHGNNTVSIHARRNRLASANRIGYRPRPVTVIREADLRFPHSVAFAPRSNALVVTNAGANHFDVFAKLPGRFRHRWAETPASRHIVGDETVFREVNASNKMEGGPKGIAIHGDSLAICSPECGVKIYRLVDRPS